MPGCAAIGCTNSAKKGFLMKHFPRDPKRRKEWADKIRRSNWFPKDSSCVCEVHFAAEMWEKVRVDGSRKLKLHAVPTIFSMTEQLLLVKKPLPKRVFSSRRSVRNPSTSTASLKLSKVLSQGTAQVELQKESSDWLTVRNPSTITASLGLSKELSQGTAQVERQRESPNRLVSTVGNPSTSTASLELSKVLSQGTAQVELQRESSDCLISTASQIKDKEDSKMQSSLDTSFQKPRDESVSFGNTIFKTLSDAQKMEMYRKLAQRKAACLNTCRNKLRSATHKISTLEKNLAQRNDHLFKNTFNEEQILAMKKKGIAKSTKFMSWSDSTIIKSLKLKFACGNSGYEELLKQNLPYPSIRTLQRRLQNLKFDSGVLYEVFNFLKYKVESFNENQRDCMLVLDEMAIIPGKIYDVSLNKYFGDITLPEHLGTATHVLVFNLAGINTRWKQMVAYYFTGNSVNGSVVKDIMDTILSKANDINLNVICVTSDIGSCNQALWRTLGICAGRHEIIRNSIVHPSDVNEKIYFLVDVPDLFKSLKASFVNNKIIKLSKHIGEKYSLPTQVINVNHISELIEYQNTLHFKFAPKATQADLLPSGFHKAKDSRSKNVLSHDVCGALKYVAEKVKKTEYLTTAWFIEKCDKWFYLMTSRSPVNAISKLNSENYINTIQFLNDFMEIINSFEIGTKESWEPTQTGILTSTKSVLQLQELLLEKRNYEFVLIGRFSQGCLESPFSALRSKQVIPNAVQVKNNLKVVCISQYLKCPKDSS